MNLKVLLAATAIPALATVAYAQTTTPAPSTTPSATAPAPSSTTPSATTNDTVMAPEWYSQQQGEWRTSKLVGSKVKNKAGDTIGDINEIILTNDGSAAAAVIGVGGFLGVGQKDVAVPFESLQIQRKQNSSSIDKITVTYTKDQLSNAPKFAYFQVQSNTTTGSGGMASPGGMSKPASPTGK